MLAPRNATSVDPDDTVIRLSDFVMRRCVVRAGNEPLCNSRGEALDWLLDLRIAILDAVAGGWIVDALWSLARPLWPFQLAAQELAAVPLLGAMLARGAAEGLPVSGLIVRRERKVHGRQRLLEGELNGEKIILIDDIVNSGRSVARAIDILAEQGGTVVKVLSVLDFGNSSRDFGDTMPDYAFVLPLGCLGLPLEPRRVPLDQRPLQAVWRQAAEGTPSCYIARKATPVVAGDLVLHATEAGRLSALDRATGGVRWQRQLARRSKGLWSTPLVFGDGVYIGSYEGALVRLNLRDGTTVWTFDDADWIGSSPVTDGRRIYVGLEYALHGGCGAIVAVDIESGRLEWRHDVPSPVHATPTLLGDDHLVCGSNAGTLFCLDRETGAVRWTTQMGGAVRAPAVSGPAGRRLFVGAADGSVQAVESGTGRIAWRFQTDGEIYAPPLLRGAFLYAPSADGVLYKLCAQTGRALARQRLGGKILVTPAVDGDDLLVGSTRGRLVRIRMSDFRVTATHDLDVRITSDIVVDGPHIYVAGADGDLVAIVRQEPASDMVPSTRRDVPVPRAASAFSDALAIGRYNRQRAGMTETDFQVWQDFLSRDERVELVEWALRMKPHLRSNSAHRQYRQTDTLPECPSLYTKVRERLEERACLDQAEREPAFGWYLSVIDRGGAVHSHLDPTLPGKRHLRCNLFLQLPERGGLPIIEGHARSVAEGDMLAFFPSERRHRSEVVVGDRSRIICSFGYLVPADYTLPARRR